MTREGYEPQPSNEPPENELTQEDLEIFLHEGGVSTADWGKGEAKTIEDLHHEVTNGEARLEQRDGKLVRIINVARADVFYMTYGPDVILQLREVEQVFKADDRVRPRNLGQAVGEKIIHGEDPDDAIVRGIHEELGVNGEIEVQKITTSPRNSASTSFPGLTTEGVNHDYNVFLTPEQYVHDGYVENGEKITTKFRWRDITE